jgi:hypothetical protein
MAAIENQEHICPRSIQIALDEVPSDMAELLGKALLVTPPPSTKVSGGHRSGVYYIPRHFQVASSLSR